MSLVSDLNNTDLELQKCQGDMSYLANSSGGVDIHFDTEKMDDEEEDEDIDFNPLLVAESPSGASSSLSSEDEISGEATKNHLEIKDAKKTLNHKRTLGNECQGMELESTLPSGANEEASVIAKPYKKRPVASNSTVVIAAENSKLYSQTGALHDKGNDEDTAVKDFVCSNNTHQPLTPDFNLTEKLRNENEDAIFKRTRARHSLVNYTLEELETFLQESDDDDNAHNIDDEEEYRKFLTAVLRGADNDGKDDQEDENFDEDEENDADFEIEIEEALESDVGENTENDRYTKNNLGSNGHVPETRQKRFQKNKKVPVNGSSIPLRPLLPSSIDRQSVSFPSVGLCSTSFSNFQHCTSSLTSSWITPINAMQGFSTAQIGQLYCLLHEHVQLLIQLFSLCILDPSWHHIASSFKKMIIELAEKREGAISARETAHPAACFDNLHVYLSEKTACNLASDCCPCVPVVRNPVTSILDVTALSLAKEYISDISVVVAKYRSYQIEAHSDKSYSIKQPLFPLPNCISANMTPDDGRGATGEIVVHRPASSEIKQKKSLAAELIENAKKQPIAQVPKGIADLARRFLPMFNSALFPRKPPSTTISKRIYFTESEDKLLAMGILEYNNDWTAIQQRFLPCKSRHQIFVRQKNRSSSKAPENPIKTVRHMKTSPLTANEMALINKGLQIFKNDLNAVCKFLVPHRDPSLLPRQWRTACGEQKSYKKSDSVKEKRRLYESKRRKLKSIECKQITCGKEVDDSSTSAHDSINEDDEAHEALLVESNPRDAKATQTMTSQTGIVPYQVYNAGAQKVIKLAPDLPPVNLPPSVRVISQSAFQSYHGVSLPPAVNLGNIKIGNSLKEPKSSSDVPSNNCHRNGSVLVSSNKADHLSANDGHLGSDLLTHPLSRGPEKGSSSSYPSSCGNISRHQKEPTSLQTIDFHPILQRSKDDAACNVFPNSNNRSVPSTSPYEKENDIDLDIHLSSTVDKNNIRTSATLSHHHSRSRSGSLAVLHHERTDSRTRMAPSFTRKHNDAVIRSEKNFVSNREYAGGHIGIPLQRDSAQLDRENNTSDKFLADIVMEQEELSDSEDDTEHVEFEYEEMDDSEEELLDCEPIRNEHLAALQQRRSNLVLKMDALKNHRVGSSSGFNDPSRGYPVQMVPCSSRSTSLKSKQKAAIRTANQPSYSGVSSHRSQREVHTNKALQQCGSDLIPKMDASKNRRVGSSSGLNDPCRGYPVQMDSCSSRSTSLKSKQKAAIRTANQPSHIGVSSHLSQRKVHTNKAPKLRSKKLTKSSS